MSQQSYYLSLQKPNWAPPSNLFGIVWPFLYCLILVSFGWTIWKIVRGEWPLHLLVPLILNVITNALYTPLFFTWKLGLLATIDNYLVVVTLVWFMVAIWHYAKWPALILIPYLAWVVFASVLQTSIYVMNR